MNLPTLAEVQARYVPITIPATVPATTRRRKTSEREQEGPAAHRQRQGHWYKLDGEKADGVTTLLGNGIPKPALINWGGEHHRRIRGRQLGRNVGAVARRRASTS
ncbi:hypothetical protein GS909_07910 [Rhodococcus hoagii]|nr:hypothetical protein [Prescottella equi]